MISRTGFFILAACVLTLWLAPAAAGAAVQITKRDCQRLVAYRPDPGVAYVPGADARGRPVAPADLSGAPRIALPETIVIDIEADLQDRFGFPARAESFEGDAQIGVVEVAPDGTASFNGQPLQDDAQAALTRRCQEILRQ